MNTKTQQVATVEPLPVKADPMAILQAAVERGVDADQLGKLMDLQERYQASQARVAFSSAMADFQAHCPTIMKSKKADRYSYAPLDEILRTIRPHLDANGLSIRFGTTAADGEITALCYVSHRDGHTEQSQFTAPIDPAMKVNDTQKVGSANSYAKRYALCNALNLVGSEFDDDGYSAATPMITDKQLIELRDNIEALDIEVHKFCKFLNVKSLEAIPAAKWPMVEKAIEVKRKQAESK